MYLYFQSLPQFVAQSCCAKRRLGKYTQNLAAYPFSCFQFNSIIFHGLSQRIPEMSPPTWNVRTTALVLNLVWATLLHLIGRHDKTINQDCGSWWEVVRSVQASERQDEEHILCTGIWKAIKKASKSIFKARLQRQCRWLSLIKMCEQWLLTSKRPSYGSF